MKKKVLSLLLVLCMILVMLAGCGSSSDSSSSSSTSDADETEEVEEAEEEEEEEVEEAEEEVEEEAEEAEEEAEEEEAAEEEPAEEAAEEEAAEETSDSALYNDTVISYPLSTTGESLSIFCTKPGGPSIVRDTWADVEIFQEAEEYLGVTIEWNEVDMTVLETQFNLMVAAGDYADIISGVVQNYSTGAIGAYEDGVVIDIADYVYDNMPNYWNWVHTDSETESYVMTEEGYELAIYVVNDQQLVEKGLLIRQDWLDDVGLDVPETFDELEEALLAFKTEYNCDNALYVGETGLGITALVCGYDIVYFDDDLALYVDDDGQLVCSYMTDNYRDYLEMMNRWYEEGLFDGDMILNSDNISMNDTQTYVCNEDVGAFHTSANQLSTYYTYSINENFDVTPINVIVQNEGDDTTNRFASYEPVQTGQTVSISTDCENVELALRWLDYWYSDEGTMYMTYGIEGYTYEIDEDGNVYYTDMVVNNDDGMSPEGMIMKYNCSGKIAGVMMQKAQWYYYSDIQKEVTDFWSTQVSYDRAIPGYVSMTTEETLEYNNIIADITTYAESELSKFLFGTRDFSEWDDFTAELEAMGINDAIAIYQEAYDRQVVS